MVMFFGSRVFSYARAGHSLIAALVFSLAAACAHAQFLSDDRQRQVPTSQAQMDLSFAPLVREASPAVVNVYTKKVVQTRDIMRDIFGRRFSTGQGTRQRVQNSLGSGVIVSSDGVIVTNNHVIDGADEFLVVLSDRREYPAELVLADERTDLAVMKIDIGDETLPALDFADTTGVAVGDLVLAIGNPFGVGQTVTSGIISATARTDVGISDYAFFLQTDAAVNPGNSGGALINTAGQLVGVNTAIFSRSGGSNGIGFAIPSEMVKRVVDAAVNEGMIVRPWLGLKAQAVTFDIAQSQGLDRPVGVIVSEVYDAAPADRAGLRRGDLITSIEGREVFDETGLKFLAATRSPGDLVPLTVIRGGEERVILVRLEPPPGAKEAERLLLNGRHPFAGAEVAQLSPFLAEELGRDPFETGILVTRIQRGAYAWRLIRPGDVILSIDDRPVLTITDLEEALTRSRGRWLIELDRNGRRVRGTVNF